MTDIDFNTVVDAIDRSISYSTLSDVLRLDYSGRGMYGKTCFGIVTDYKYEFFTFLVEVAAEDIDVARFLADKATLDNMGMGMIYYFPQVTLTNVPNWFAESEDEWWETLPRNGSTHADHADAPEVFENPTTTEES